MNWWQGWLSRNVERPNHHERSTALPLAVTIQEQFHKYYARGHKRGRYYALGLFGRAMDAVGINDDLQERIREEAQRIFEAEWKDPLP